TMASAHIVFYLMCLFLGVIAQKNNLRLSSVHEEARFISAKSGDRVTLHCYYEHNVAAVFYWYKQTLGEKPKPISTLDKSEDNFVQFHGPFNNTTRFRLDNEKGKKNLIISDLSVSDSATYYCIFSYFYTLMFLETIIVSVNDSDLNVQALVHQSASETIQPGGSVSLHCMVHTMLSCDGEHSVYWFKDSEDSQPGLIYTHGVRNDQCERKANKRTHTCVYNLRMESLNVSQTGIYYCAVQIIFDELKMKNSAALMYFLSAALTLTTIISVSSTFLVYKMKKRNNCQSRGLILSYFTLHHDADNLHYTALSINLPNSSTRQRNNRDECLYSSVKQQVIFFPIQRKKKIHTFIRC
uniref:Ig-like domain-containing protein n=1 Tax=Astatotilapia calliptera TaxID=8154 RepID=A0A3P8Q964_ASTCA